MPRRLHPVVIGTLAAVAALVAAVVTAIVFSVLTEEPARPIPELELRFSAGDQDSTSGLAGDVASGDPLPDERFSMLAGGFGSFADYRGKPLVVNFFASNCAPCVEEMPAFEAVHQELGDEVAFLGMNFQDQVSTATELVERTGVSYDVARDPSGEVARSLGMVVMPSTYFVSPEGKVMDAKAGAMDADELRRRIEDLRT
ncbi:MAG TPA: TlpA disulfide reductase family protein [Acidimicrobiales bacterium]|nr:TlpA disulfide reductase family protein [Acidimicrobiales bacterium]